MVTPSDPPTAERADYPAAARRIAPPALAVLVGLQASGKSTFYARHLAARYLHVSKDNWPSARRREARQQRTVAEALAARQAVAVDNTNASVAERAPLIELPRAAGVPVIAYWFPPDLRSSLERNGARSGLERVPDVGVLATAKRLTRPIREEGFDVTPLLEPAPPSA